MHIYTRKWYIQPMQSVNREQTMNRKWLENSSGMVGMCLLMSAAAIAAAAGVLAIVLVLR